MITFQRKLCMLLNKTFFLKNTFCLFTSVYLYHIQGTFDNIKGPDCSAGSKLQIPTLADNQTLSLQDLCKDMHGTALRLFRAKASPMAIFSMLRIHLPVNFLSIHQPTYYLSPHLHVSHLFPIYLYINYLSIYLSIFYISSIYPSTCILSIYP